MAFQDPTAYVTVNELDTVINGQTGVIAYVDSRGGGGGESTDIGLSIVDGKISVTYSENISE